MPKRQPSNTAASQVKAMLNAAAPEFEPPAHVRLPAEARPFWSSIMLSRARDEWAKNDFVIAAQLARCQYDIERESILLEQEGSVVENARGTQIMNPRNTVLEQLARRELALMRALAMTATTAGKEKHLQQAARKAERQAGEAREQAAGEVTDDDLLAL